MPRKGAIVRSRRHVLNTQSDRRARAARSPRQAVAAALGSPLLASALPLRVASFALQGPERDKVQLLIHADVGTDYPSSKVDLGRLRHHRQERPLVDSKAADMRLLPVMSGVPSPLQYTAGASLPPGDYTLKLAAVEGERVGTVEHLIHAGLPAVGDLTLSELMVGGPLDVGELLTPTIGYQINFGSVHGYLEAYGAETDAVTIEYEVATDLGRAGAAERRRAAAPGQRRPRHLHESRARRTSCRRASTSCARSCRPRASRSRR